jgi:ABC-2 type transport system permease protein
LERTDNTSISKIDMLFRGVLLIIKKNIKCYIKEPPVIMFGFLFPIFLFLSFFMGRNVDFNLLFPGLFGMATFFVATAIGPVITPFEKFFKTYERLLSYPVTIPVIITADILSGVAFSLVAVSFLIIPAVILLHYSPNFVLLVPTLLIGSVCFASFGSLLSSPHAPTPSQVMIRSNLVRFPLVFISGIFIPFSDLPPVGKALSYFSPISYFIDSITFVLRGYSARSIIFDYGVLLLFSCIFIALANIIQKKNLEKI